MNTVNEVMNHEPLFCTPETRIAEIKHLLKKYDSEELMVVDSIAEKHPIGLVNMNDVSIEDIEEASIPSDVSAAECMRVIPAVVHIHSTLEECLNIMRANGVDRLPVVDLNGHMTGVIEREEIAKTLIH